MTKNGSAPRSVPASTGIYVRLSREREGQTSTERQEAECRAWADSRGLEITKVFTDTGKSGYRNVRREGFEDALRALESGEIGTLLVWKLDRLSRRGIGQVGQVLDQLEASGGRIVSVVDNLDTSQPQARIVVALLAELARAESSNTGQRVSSAKQALRRKGKWHAGSPPYGLRRRDDGHLEPHPERAPIVRRIVEEALSGRSLRSITQGLTADGVPAPRGNQWHVGTVTNILRSPVLAGSLGRGDDGELIEVPALVSPGEAAQVAALIDARSIVDKQGRPRGARRPPRALLTGLLRCAHCEAAMTADIGRGRYLCSGRSSGRQCPGNAVNANRVEELVVREALTYLHSFDPDPEHPLLATVGRRWVAATDPAKLRERQLKEQALEDAEARLADLEAARYERDEFKDREKRYEAIRARLDASVAAAKDAIAALPPEVSLDSLVQLMNTARESWQELDLATQRAVLAACVEAVYMRKADGFGPKFDRRRVRIEW